MDINDKRRELEIECCHAEEEVESIEFGIKDLENALSVKRANLEKAINEVERLSALLEQIDDVVERIGGNNS